MISPDNYGNYARRRANESKKSAEEWEALAKRAKTHGNLAIAISAARTARAHRRAQMMYSAEARDFGK